MILLLVLSLFALWVVAVIAGIFLMIDNDGVDKWPD